MNLELTGRSVKRTVDIARAGSRVISRTDTALPAVRRGTRQTCARHIFVSQSFFYVQKKCVEEFVLLYKICYSVGFKYDCSQGSASRNPPRVVFGRVYTTVWKSVLLLLVSCS